jgi:hypothetical protein
VRGEQNIGTQQSIAGGRVQSLGGGSTTLKYACKSYATINLAVCSRIIKNIKKAISIVIVFKLFTYIQLS